MDQMRPTSKLDYARSEKSSLHPGLLYRFSSASNGDEDHGNEAEQRAAPRGEDLPYKVELWDAARSSVEQVLAVTRNGSIGYAAYFEATRQYPDRYLTLRHQGKVLSRWNGPGH
jgi:hypothetical protein